MSSYALLMQLSGDALILNIRNGGAEWHYLRLGLSQKHSTIQGDQLGRIRSPIPDKFPEAVRATKPRRRTYGREKKPAASPPAYFAVSDVETDATTAARDVYVHFVGRCLEGWRHDWGQYVVLEDHGRGICLAQRPFSLLFLRMEMSLRAQAFFGSGSPRRPQQ